jgi:hypothetical protein
MQIDSNVAVCVILKLLQMVALIASTAAGSGKLKVQMHPFEIRLKMVPSFVGFKSRSPIRTS